MKLVIYKWLANNKKCISTVHLHHIMCIYRKINFFNMTNCILNKKKKKQQQIMKNKDKLKNVIFDKKNTFRK